MKNEELAAKDPEIAELAGRWWRIVCEQSFMESILTSRFHVLFPALLPILSIAISILHVFASSSPPPEILQNNVW